MPNNIVRCKVRIAIYSDIEQMVSLLEELFGMENDFFPDAEAQRRGLKLIFDNPATAKILVAETDCEVVGMCALHSRMSTFYGAETGVIEDVVVKKEFRGKGVGRQLLYAAEKHALENGLKHLHLLMDKDNSPAELFYSELGWSRTGLVCMRKKLEENR